MDEATVKSTIAKLMNQVSDLTSKVSDAGTLLAKALVRIEALQAENNALRVAHHDCSQTVGQLTEALAIARAKEARYQKRPPVLHGRTVQTNVGCGPLYITLNEDESGRPFEVFFKLGKSGSCQQSYLEALGVAMSVGLRYGADPKKYIEKFQGMRCPNPKMRSAEGPQTLSCADGISQGLAKAISIAVALPGFEAHEVSDAQIHRVAEPAGVISLLDQPQLSSTATATKTLDEKVTHLVAAGAEADAAYGDAVVGEALARSIRNGGAGLCPECSGPLISQGGCVNCASACGYVGKCG